LSPVKSGSAMWSSMTTAVAELERKVSDSS
jgi:hypothetical protein